MAPASSSPVMHSLLLSRLTDHFYPSTVTIQQYTATQDTDGAEVKTWANVAGHVDLACSRAAQGGDEQRRPDGTIAVSPWRVAITGYYASITPKMRAVLGGVNYDILAVQHDSQSDQTYLVMEIVT